VRIGLFYSAAPAWKEYTVVSLFLFDGKASALLSRDSFFSDSSVPAPSPRTGVLDKRQGRVKGAGIPAFENFLPAEGWDVDVLRLGNDSLWYYRVSRKEPPEYRYFRTPSLLEQGEETQLGPFRAAAGLEPLESSAELPGGLLYTLLNRAEAFAQGAVYAAVVSSAFPAARRFSLPGRRAEDAALLWGCYQGGENPKAVFIFPSGRGFLAKAISGGGIPGGEEGRSLALSIRDYSLPFLPEGFSYTGIGLDGGILFASWEERQDYHIGAAGFLVLKLP
jgi:hypothetical protein